MNKKQIFLVLVVIAAIIGVASIMLIKDDDEGFASSNAFNFVDLNDRTNNIKNHMAKGMMKETFEDQSSSTNEIYVPDHYVISEYSYKENNPKKDEKNFYEKITGFETDVNSDVLFMENDAGSNINLIEEEKKCLDKGKKKLRMGIEVMNRRSGNRTMCSSPSCC